MTNIIVSLPGLVFYRVKLVETVALLVVEGWIRYIPAQDKQQAARKALLWHMKRNPGSRPSLAQVELEPESRPIQI